MADPIQRRLCRLGLCRNSLPHPVGLDTCLQHHCFVVGARPPQHLHDQHRLRPAQAHQGAAASCSTLVSRPFRHSDQWLRILLLRVHDHILLLPGQLACGSDERKLGAIGVGCGYRHLGGVVHDLGQVALHSACGVCRRQKSCRCWLAVIMMRSNFCTRTCDLGELQKFRSSEG